MIGLEAIGIMAGGLAGLGLLEGLLHRRHLEKIPVRIHVGGTRGKSSVTRLIAAGLNHSGVRTAAKTTGTTARMILPDQREVIGPLLYGLKQPINMVSYSSDVTEILNMTALSAYEVGRA